MVWGTRSRVHQLLLQVFISCSILISVKQSLAFCKFTGQSRNLISLLNFLLQYCRSPLFCNKYLLFFDIVIIIFIFIFVILRYLKYSIIRLASFNVFTQLFYNIRPFFFEHGPFCQFLLFPCLKLYVSHMRFSSYQ